MNVPSTISPEWIETQFLLWREDPARVTAEWRAFFAGFALAREAGVATDPALALKQSAVQSLIYRYRDIGHLLACTDPLSTCPGAHPLLSLEAFGLDESDLDTVFHTRRFLKESATLREIVETLRETYCRTVGVEFMHIQDPEERQWLMGRMETVRNRPSFPAGEKEAILRKLQEAALFEEFLHRKFMGQKRFSLEGGEALISLLDGVVRRAPLLGVSDLILGTTHRGRLNLLANIFAKPLENIFDEFRDNLEHGFVGEGDVKYHKGFSTDISLPGGARLHLTLASNPSHLEAVDPVVEGKCRARQDGYGKGGENRVLPVLVHGDAAFAGQGMVAETLNLSQLAGYRTGGTLHVVLNNQIGFTTVPADARSTRYATDVAKMLSVPIFHVHGEDPEGVLHAAALALDYRQTFGRDVVVEIICYRRHGHNEGDEPYFTQPLMYEKIQKRPPVHRLYAERLVGQGWDGARIEALQEAAAAPLEAALAREPRILEPGFQGKWHGILRDYSAEPVATAAPAETLRALAARMRELPEGFNPHPKVARVLERRQEAVRSGEGIDWATAESLAFAALLAEGVPVRLSGQDCRRGTFSQRHAALFDVESGAVHVPLAALGRFRAYDSMLSEAAVLGFEYGYALESPGALTLWEAQFGDFANGAQVIIDQFIASSETKWDRVCGLTLLLPHGYEGQGAEHSSARIERFLQLCAGNNLQVVYPSTPGQYFHLLRRQAMQPFRRPLVVFTPKSLLRHPRCVSSLDALAAGTFREVIAAAVEPGAVRSVLFCSGKVAIELEEKLEESGRQDVALIRIEQLYPLHRDLLEEALAPYRAAEDVAWVQEEPANMGAWSHLRSALAQLAGRELRYVGRDEAAAPAVGSHRLHKDEQERLLAEALAGSGKQ